MLKLSSNVNECKPLPYTSTAPQLISAASRPWNQGLTLVQFSAQRKHFVWDRGCSEGVFVGYLGGLSGYVGGVGCILCQERLRLS